MEDLAMGLARAAVAAKTIDHRRDKKEAKKEEKEKAAEEQKTASKT
jgi:hypothetical protein